MTTGKKKPPSRRPAKKTAPPPVVAEVTPLPAHEQDPPLLTVLNDAIKHMSWLKESDEPTVQLCREYCRRIDDAKRQLDEFEEFSWSIRELAESTESKVLLARLAALEKAVNLTKVVAWVGPLLAGSLRDIGAAPAERKGLDADAPVKSRLAELRAGATVRTKPGAR